MEITERSFTLHDLALRLWDCEPVERDELDRTVSWPTSLSPAGAEVRMDPLIDVLYAVNAIAWALLGR